jgi:ribonuclease HI
MLPAVTIYSDGACDPNPGPGGWAALIEGDGSARTVYGGARQTTNNRMELTAVIEALRALPEASAVCISTDSEYLQRGITEWLAKWQRKNWRTQARKPVANRDLWEQLLDAEKRHRVQWLWVRGHNGDPRNEKVDRLARSAIPN